MRTPQFFMRLTRCCCIRCPIQIPTGSCRRLCLATRCTASRPRPGLRGIPVVGGLFTSDDDQPGPCGRHGPETALSEMKQCVDTSSSDRVWCNTAETRSFEPWVPPLRLIAAFCRLGKSLRCWEKGWLVGGGDRKHYPAEFQGLGRNAGER